MYNIWDLLFFSFNITLTAGLILIMKKIFKDLLSARWQYGIWSVLFLRTFIPMGSSRNFLLPVSQHIENLKYLVESDMKSLYTESFDRISISFPFAVIKGEPWSITDALFVAYAAGVVAFALIYLLSYMRLRFIVKKGSQVSAETDALINEVCRKYNLKRCRAVCIDTTSSAFICGFMKPVLVFPKDKETDEKIILHELLHLKNKDTLQNTLWCILRCINWWNPAMHYVFSLISNDIEAYCDLRVMERLEGEERRDYGRVLLGMVNKAYQRVPCTSSVSNGGKNISRRIDSIVKFKKYPKGMALVSVCITILTAVFCIYGSAVSYVNDYEPTKLQDFRNAVSVAKTQRCKTLPSAVDAYAKALRHENGIMLLHAASEERQREIIDSMLSGDSETLYYYSSGEEFKYCDPLALHLVYNYTKISDKKYYCDLIIALTCEDKSELEEMYSDAIFDEMKDANENIIYEYKGYLVIPLYVEYDGEGWIVTGEGERYICDDIEHDITLRNRDYTAKGKTGEVTYFYHTSFRHNSDDVLDFQLKSYLKVKSIRDEYLCIYKANEDTIKNSVGKSFTMVSKEYRTVEEYEAEYREFLTSAKEKDYGKLGRDDEEYISVNGSDTSGAAWYNIAKIDTDWDGKEKMGGGGGFSGSGIDIDEYQLPEVIAVWIKSGDEVIDEFIIYPEGGSAQ